MPTPDKFDILVCYDVKTTHESGEVRLRKVSKACTQFGQRVQYSIFECSLTSVNLERLRQKLLDIIDTNEDNLRIYFLQGSRSKFVQTYGKNKWMDFDGPLII